MGAALQVRRRQAHHTITMVALHHRQLPTTITTMSTAGVKRCTPADDPPSVPAPTSPWPALGPWPSRAWA